VEIGINIAHDVRMMPILCVIKLCTALIHKETAENRPKMPKNVLPSGEVK